MHLWGWECLNTSGNDHLEALLCLESHLVLERLMLGISLHLLKALSCCLFCSLVSVGPPHGGGDGGEFLQGGGGRGRGRG